MSDTYDEDQHRNAGPPRHSFQPNAAFFALQAAVLIFLSTLAFMAGKLTRPEVGPPHVTDDVVAKDSAQQLLRVARDHKTWSPADERRFTLALSQLSLQTRYQLSLDLAGLVNKNQVAVLPGPEVPPALPYCIPVSCEEAGAGRYPPERATTRGLGGAKP
jgi:hypothetical protein